MPRIDVRIFLNRAFYREIRRIDLRQAARCGLPCRPDLSWSSPRVCHMEWEKGGRIVSIDTGEVRPFTTDGPGHLGRLMENGSSIRLGEMIAGAYQPVDGGKAIVNKRLDDSLIHSPDKVGPTQVTWKEWFYRNMKENQFCSKRRDSRSEQNLCGGHRRLFYKRIRRSASPKTANNALSPNTDHEVSVMRAQRKTENAWFLNEEMTPMMSNDLCRKEISAKVRAVYLPGGAVE